MYILHGRCRSTTSTPWASFPQGRNITQYQFIDDFTLDRGKHTLKFGENFRRYDVSDHNFFFQNPGVYFGYTTNGMQKFADGLAYQYRKGSIALHQRTGRAVGHRLVRQDEWNVTSNLKLTLALRAEHNSNPVCQTNCFSNFNAPITSLSSFTRLADSGQRALHFGHLVRPASGLSRRGRSGSVTAHRLQLVA